MMRLKLPADEEIRTAIIRVVEKKAREKLLEYVYQYKHFENMLIILMEQNYQLFQEGKTENDFKYLSSYQVMRAVIRETEGGKDKEKADYIKEKYKNNELMNQIIESGKKLKIHNLSMILNSIKSNFQGFFTKIKKGIKDASPPKPKKLCKVNHFSIPLDINAWSLQQKDQIGLNLSNQMFYIPLKHESLIKIVLGLDKVQAICIHMRNNDIYLNISYRYKIKQKQENKNIKEAGLDIGINNLASIAVNDENTPSIIVDGTVFKHYNSQFNRFIAKLNSSIDKLDNAFKVIPQEEDKNCMEKLRSFRRFLHEKRYRYFYDQFHKMSKRILEYLEQQEVTDLFISKNLASLKNNGNCHLNKSSKQNFIQIPFIRLLQYIEYKATEYGIRVHVVDESYTSKTSCISGDVVSIQQMAQHNKPILTNDFKGSRVKRGLFKDSFLSKVFNADINAAFNIIKVGTSKSMDWLKDFLFKLANPIKLTCDWELVCFLH